eukprot:TRINITY_DN5620_c0_g4_i2.p1 TRINITY_DN5620_c0_g4~~TRINITY_DN5620_c0_g4_i2.p1  ORF type:complete len:146 (+),score=43.97 TRINITY_DN5620_c0_g4_i2:211-648(+)
MSRVVASLLVIALCFTAAFGKEEWKQLDTSVDEVVTASQFALERLQGLSEYYPSLKLVNVKSARAKEGVFHYVWDLGLELELEGKKSKHQVMVMRHLETGTLSFAIDEFPKVTLKDKDKDPYANYGDLDKLGSDSKKAAGVKEDL